MGTFKFWGSKRDDRRRPAPSMIHDTSKGEAIMNKTVTRRISLNGFLALILVPCLVQAQRTIPVEVVNTSAAPMPVVVQNGNSGGTGGRLIGFTTQPVADGLGMTQGLSPVNETCEAEFPGTRICTTEEVLNSAPKPTINGMSYWVRGIPGHVLPTSGNSAIFFEKVTGISREGDLRFASPFNCVGYGSGSFNGASGMVVLYSFAFGTRSCGNPEVGVACCSPSP